MTELVMWVSVVVATECMALAGVISIAVTKGTRIAFVLGFNTMALVTGIFVWHYGLTMRAVIVLAMVFVYLARMNWMLLVWSRQTAIEKLNEKLPAAGKFAIPLVLANTVGFAYCLPVYFAVRIAHPLELSDVIGIGIYVVGTVIHFGADYQKHHFKTRRGTEGRVLDVGFWALCRHPNYFGDFLIYVAFALMSHSVWGWVAPLVNVLQYAFDAIPKNERWAAERYGQAWEAYRARVKAFVPYIV
jgi:steroid 5-alpha reductase family enzyme